MLQTITISKSTYQDLLKRIKLFEKIVLKKNTISEVIDNYKTEKKQKKLKKLTSVNDLFN